MVIESTVFSSTAIMWKGGYPTDVPVTRTKRRTVPAFRDQNK
jgi:hypothetical protein